MTARTATQWGVYDVEVHHGNIEAVVPLDIDPDPSPIGEALVDGTLHPLRVESPAVRKGWLEGGPQQARGRRGADPFVEVTWDEALDLAAREIDRVVREHGNTAVYGGSYGWASAGRFHHAQSQLHRFLNCIGGCTRSLNSYSTAAAQVILPHILAPWHTMELEQTTWREIAEGSRLMVSFGGLPLRNSQVAYGGITQHEVHDGMQRAARCGVQFVTIGPLADDTPEFLGHRWIPCRPGTDVALMLGLAHVLETEGRVDAEFLDRYTVGYAHLRAYLLGETDGVPKTPDWAHGITGVAPDAIIELAREMTRGRTLLNAAWALQRGHHGEQPYWMLVALACMLGDIGLTGGGVAFGQADEGHIGSSGRRFGWPTLSKGLNPTGLAIPVARVADMLLHPGTTIDYDGHRIEYPDIHLIYWAGGNPFHHHQDLHRLVRAWQRPDTVIVHEPWWTPVARHADIVFPATTALEREDICASSHDPFAHAMQQVIAPHAEARSDFEILRTLAHRLGCESSFTEGRSATEWLRHLWQESRRAAVRDGFELPEFDDFWAAGIHRLPDPPTHPGWLSSFREDPQANPLATPSGKIEIFSERIAGFGYDDCPGHPTWLEPFERLGGLGNDRYPFHLVSHQPATRLHSQLDHSAFSQRHKVAGREALRIHPDAAAARGIVDGDTVRVFNDRGQCLAGARLDRNLMTDVVALPTGAWFDPLEPGAPGGLELAGNPNVLTRDVGTSSLAQGPSAHTCLVEVERHSAEAPLPRVYSPPVIERRDVVRSDEPR
jgi:biotin/methionine sulfoxide reductase